ncbi:MAG: preprotein translocase subunit YajC [Leptospirales bacterium]|nr:preprotein translocase subunit YajC [Leptospirales bacterium]
MWTVAAQAQTLPRMDMLEYIAQQSASAPTPSSGAQQAPAPGSQSPFGFGDPFFFVVIGGLFLFMWLFVMRPQRKEEKRKKEMLSLLKKGDRVVTTAGILGSVANVKDETVTLNVGDGARIEFLRSAISSVVSENGTAVEVADSKPAKKK